MTRLIPHSFHFRFALRCRRHDRLPSRGKHLVPSRRENRIAHPSQMDRSPTFAEIELAWNDAGLAVAWQIEAKSEPIHGEPGKPPASDGLSLWLDTRDARTVHRATRFCQRFLLLPTDPDADAAPTVRRHPVKRAAEDSPAVDTSSIACRLFSIDEDGDQRRADDPRAVAAYRFEAFLPSEAIFGFDPENNRRLGLFTRIRDHELGDQLLSCAADIPYWEDPSLWSVLELAD